MPTWIKPSTATKLSMKDINESYWLGQNLYRTWENWPKLSKWSIPEAAEGKKFLLRTSARMSGPDQIGTMVRVVFDPVRGPKFTNMVFR